MKTSSGAVATPLTPYSFALTTFQKLLENTPSNENLCYSPFGIQLVLTLLHALSARESREPFLKPFEYGRETPVENMRALQVFRRGYSYDPDIKVASSLWLRDPQRFTSSAREEFRREFDCDLFHGDFGPSTVLEINRWVEKNTGGRIRHIACDLLSGLLLAPNVIYFRGKWVEPFDESLTELQWFTLADRSKVRHPRMRMDGGFAYYEDSECQAVRLYYGSEGLANHRFSMFVILPIDNTLPTLLQEMGKDGLANKFDSRVGHLEWPRFTFRCDPRITLATLGLPSSLCLDPNIVTAATAEVPVELAQSVWIRVDEAGTEAAAVTLGTVFSSELRRKPRLPFRMIVDRPFYFLISDNITDAILFMARVVNPASELQACDYAGNVKGVTK